MKALRTNSKIVRAKVEEHILSMIDGDIDMLRENNNALLWGDKSDYQAAKEQVDSGNFLIYNLDIKDFLNSLGINPSNKEYSDNKSFELYKHLVAREIVELIK